MTLVAMHSTDVEARSGAAARVLRSLRVVVAQARHKSRVIRRERSFPVLLRSLVVGGVISVVAVLALTSQPEDYGRPVERSARLRQQRVAATPFMTLSRVGDDEALDGDFSLEQAALTWAHRLIQSGGAEIDSAGRIQFGPVRVARSIVERVVQAAKTTETDPVLLMAIADKESSFSPRAKASTSSASGMFQFIDSTWLKAVRLFGWRHGHEEAAKAIDGNDGQPRVAAEKRARVLGLRNDPYLSAVLAAEMLKKDGAKIAEKLGRALTIGETYLIHFLGPNDAERFMTKMMEQPEASAADLLPRPARANRPIFYARDGGRMKERSVSEVHEAFETMMGARASRYQDVEAKLPGEVLAYADGAANAAATPAPQPASVEAETSDAAADGQAVALRSTASVEEETKRGAGAEAKAAAAKGDSAKPAAKTAVKAVAKKGRAIVRAGARKGLANGVVARSRAGGGRVHATVVARSAPAAAMTAARTAAPAGVKLAVKR